MARTASRTTPNLQPQPPRGADFERAHSSVVLGEDVRGRRRGFTIVELLIVVVVIAILAAITIVAYNGITNRSKAAAASTAAEQAAKKVMTYAVTNSDNYPASLSDAGITDGSATYQYRVDNNAHPRTFCVTATTQNVSYWVSNTAGSPTVGACPGHGANGATVITNLHTNPRFVSTAGLASQTPSGSTTSITNGGGPSGVNSFRVATTQSGQLRLQFLGGTAAVSAGDKYNVSVYVRASQTIPSMSFEVSFSNGWVAFPTASITTSWTRLDTVITVPAGATSFNNIQLLSAGGVSSSLTIEVASPQLTREAELHAYGDGNSPGWAWNGSPNNSSSTGPTL